ncbi:MAG: hypothetical protein ACRD2G_07920, partial [Terriglobia bacterium]
ATPGTLSRRERVGIIDSGGAYMAQFAMYAIRWFAYIATAAMYAPPSAPVGALLVHPERDG